MSMWFRRTTLILCVAIALVCTGHGAQSQTIAPQATAPLAGAQTPLVARQTAAPSPEAVSDCDKIAGRRPLVVSGVATHDPVNPDWTRAVVACEAEIRAHPREMRFVYQLGRAQDNLKDYIEALPNFRSAAEAGLPDALVDLGAMYYFGHGVVQNYQTAFALFAKAAASGSNRGLANLASMYGDGLGVGRDNAKALDFAEKAVEAGNPFGLKIISNHYFNGAGVPRDYPMAAQYLQQAADLGDGQAMKFLANMYESGYLGAPNADKAAELRLRAQKIDPGSRDPNPAHLPVLRQNAAVVPQISAPAPRQSAPSRYNPAWQAAPGDTSCCPNTMLVCPLGRHFCPR